MTRPGTKPQSAHEARELRARAEERLHSREPADPSETESDALRLQQELQVHQIELELQNAELGRSRDHLEAALERYTDLYDFAPVGYFTFDRSGGIFSANLTGADLLNVPRARLVGRRFESFLQSESRLVFASFLARALEGAQRESCEVALLPVGGRPRSLRLEGTASPAGNECRAAALDVTEQRAAEETVRQMSDRLEAAVKERTIELAEANAELESLGYSVSQDLRAPLRAISGFAKVLSEDFVAELPPAAGDYLQRIQDGARRMGSLIDDLLRLSHVARSELEMTTFDLAIPCRQILADLAAASPDRHVETLVSGKMLVRGDARLLQVLLENLLGNAWKFTSTAPEARIEITSFVGTDGQTDTSIRDNGAGFDMALVGKIFQPFQRLHTVDQFPGTGIGLAIVERIARRHGGSVQAECVEGLGTTFHVRLPAPREDVRPG